MKREKRRKKRVCWYTECIKDFSFNRNPYREITGEELNPDNAARRIRRIDLRDSRARHLYSILLPSPLSFAHVTFVTHTRLFSPSSSSSSFSHSTVAASHSTREYFDIRLLRSPLPDRYDVSIIFSRAFERQTDANFNHFPLHCAASEVARCGNSNRDRVVACVNTRWREINRLGRSGEWRSPNEETKDEGKMDWSEGGRPDRNLESESWN